MVTIHDRVKIIKNLVEISTKGGGGDESIPKHGGTHAKKGTDPIPQEVDGVPVDLDGIVDGQAIVFNESENKLEPGAGGGGGESNTTSNAGTGEGLALAKVGVDLPFKSLKPGAGITLNATATEVEIVADGGGGGSDAESVRGTNIQDSLPVGALAHMYFLLVLWYQNLFYWSEDISQAAWAKTAGVIINGTDGFVTPATAGNHRFYRPVDFSAGDRVHFRAKLKKGSVDWVILYFSSDNYRIGFDLLNGVVGGTITGIDNSSIADDGAGFYVVEADITTSSNSGRNVNMYPSNDGVGVNTTGDGVTPAFYAKELQIEVGTIAQNLPYIKTESTPEVGKLEYVPTPKPTGNQLLNINTNVYEIPKVSTGGVIASVANDGAGLARITCTLAHGLTTGDEIELTNTTDYNGIHTISVVSTTVYDIAVAYVSSQAGHWLDLNEYIAQDASQVKGFGETVYTRRFEDISVSNNPILPTDYSTKLVGGFTYDVTAFNQEHISEILIGASGYFLIARKIADRQVYLQVSGYTNGSGMFEYLK